MVGPPCAWWRESWRIGSCARGLTRRMVPNVDRRCGAQGLFAAGRSVPRFDNMYAMGILATSREPSLVSGGPAISPRTMQVSTPPLRSCSILGVSWAVRLPVCRD
jgi:hypothetical protein